MHMIFKKKPDLKFRNAEIEEEIHGVIRFWLERGADGFRIDVVQGLIKDDQLRDNPLRARHDPDIPWYAEGSQDPLYSSDRPEIHEIIRGMRRVSDSYDDRMLVGETWPREQERLADYLRPDELQRGFNFRVLLARFDAHLLRAP